MALHLAYRAQTAIPVEVEGLIPEAVRDKSLAEIERWTIFHGNEKLPLAEFFSVAGDPADQRLVWEGDLSGVHWIGAGMNGGQVRVEGHAGRHLGSEMCGGEIEVRGDAGDWVGGEMHGGLIRVRGKAGHLIGSAYRGSRRGMTGGTILIDGPVGNEIGHTMRRGLLAVGGCGDFPGLNLIAGTILVHGPSGIRPAAGMRRGTVALLGPDAPPLLPTFRFGTRCRPTFLPVLYRHLARLDFALPEAVRQRDCLLYHGDFVSGGRGEILLLAN